MPKRKEPGERLRHLVHFLLNDEDYLELLQKSSPQGLSEWCRAAVREKLNPSDAVLAEREECALLAEELGEDGIADRIRSR